MFVRSFSRRLACLPSVSSRVSSQTFQHRRTISASNKLLADGLRLPVVNHEHEKPNASTGVDSNIQEVGKVDPKAKEVDPWKAAPTALLTTLSKSKAPDGKYVSNAVVYWDTKAPHITHEELEFDEKPSAILVTLKSVIALLSRAINDEKLSRIIVKLDNLYITDVIGKHLNNWKVKGYVKKDKNPVKYAELMQDLGRLTDLIQVRARLETDIKLTIKQKLDELDKNTEIAKVIEQEYAKEEDSRRLVVATTDDNIDFTDAETIYIDGVAQAINTRKISGYGVYHPSRPELCEKGRFEDFPTDMRAQMYAIQRAMELAQENRLTKIKIVLDKGFFVAFWNGEWYNKDGKERPNMDMYKTLKTIAKDIPAKFIYYYHPEGSDKENLETAIKYANEGLSLPTKHELEKGKKKEEDSKKIKEATEKKPNEKKPREKKPLKPKPVNEFPED